MARYTVTSNHCLLMPNPRGGPPISVLVETGAEIDSGDYGELWTGPTPNMVALDDSAKTELKTFCDWTRDGQPDLKHEAEQQAWIAWIRAGKPNPPLPTPEPGRAGTSGGPSLTGFGSISDLPE